MWQIIKLLIYFVLYQEVFGALVLLPDLLPVLMNTETIVGGTIKLSVSANTIGLGLVLADIVMIWHLLYFKYIRFPLKSFREISLKTIALCFPLIMAGMIFINLLAEFLALPDRLQDTFFTLSRSVLGVLSITILGPLLEEFLFRGFIQKRLVQIGVKPLYAILASSALFGVIHMNLAQIPFAFAIGLIFGWLYYRTGSLLPGIIGHIINNSLATLQMAMMTEEEFNTPTVEWLGEGPTYVVFVLSFAAMIGMFLYLKKHLPVASNYSQCHPEQSEGSETIHIVKEDQDLII